jgi:hypothetical protein
MRTALALVLVTIAAACTGQEAPPSATRPSSEAGASLPIAPGADRPTYVSTAGRFHIDRPGKARTNEYAQGAYWDTRTANYAVSYRDGEHLIVDPTAMGITAQKEGNSIDRDEETTVDGRPGRARLYTIHREAGATLY